MLGVVCLWKPNLSIVKVFPSKILSEAGNGAIKLQVVVFSEVELPRLKR